MSDLKITLKTHGFTVTLGRGELECVFEQLDGEAAAEQGELDELTERDAEVLVQNMIDDLMTRDVSP